MTRAVFTCTLFLSAFLLFLVQPLIGRLMLPLLGGSASVWTTCLVFFQVVLLCAYAWAHLAGRLSHRTQRGVHVGVLACAAVSLPLGVRLQAGAAAGSPPVLWLLMALALAVGPAFFALSTNAPTLQRWFTATSDPRRSDPYFLYGASNAGSFLGLLAYPVVLEPFFDLSTQRILWSAGYAALAGLVVWCAWLSRAAPAVAIAQRLAAPASVTWTRVASWIGLAFVPSALTAAVTAYISAEIAPVPLLWVLPLGLYLLTFVGAFSGRLVVQSSRLVQMGALLTIPLSVWQVAGGAPLWALLALHLAAFTLIAALLHSRLFMQRPPPSRLTSFYMWVAFGGALGGMFVAVVAPLVFHAAAEYPLLLMAAAVLVATDDPARRMPAERLAAALCVTVAVTWVLATAVPNPSVALLQPAGAIVLTRFRLSRLRVAATMVAALLFVRLLVIAAGEREVVARSFFGVLRVVENYRPGYRAMVHGTTVHGMQAAALPASRRGVTYYAPEGPIGQVFAALAPTLAAAHVGVIGLGAGELATYAVPGQRWTFFEIDRLVETLARRHFTYLRDSPAAMRVTIGDGRLTLAAEPRASFRVLVLDAFSSDAVPIHLLTREALAMYLARLEPDGLLAFHISNRFVDLRPVLSGLAAGAGLIGIGQFDAASPLGAEGSARLPSHWVVLARSERAISPLLHDARWTRLAPESARLWTDERADLLRVIRWDTALSLTPR